MHFRNSTLQVVLYSQEHFFKLFCARRTCPLSHCGARGDCCALIRISRKILNSISEPKFRNFRPFSMNADSQGVYSLTHFLPHQLTPSLPLSLPPSLTHSITHSLAHSLPLSLPPSLPLPPSSRSSRYVLW